MCIGLASGLTMGLLSLDETKLEIKSILGTDHERQAISLILPIIKRHHLLLVTLLLFNAISNETLPIFLGEIVPNYIAILLSVSLVLIFGEIIPSALFTGSLQLRTVCYFINFVQLLTYFFYPISYPISLLLDYWFGDDSSNDSDGVGSDDGNKSGKHDDDNTMSRKEMLALISLQSIKNTKKMKKMLKRKSSERMDAHTTSDDGYTPLSVGVDKSNNSSSNDINQRGNKCNYGSFVLLRNNINDDENVLNCHHTSLDREDHSHDGNFNHGDNRNHDDGNLNHNNVNGGNHNHESDCEHSGETISNSEINLITGILHLHDSTVQSIMIPISKVFMLSSSTRLDKTTLTHILRTGYSRVLIYRRHDRHNILGYLLVKELISLQLLPQSNSTYQISNNTKRSIIEMTMIEDICNIRIPLFVKPTVKLLDMLSIFQTNHCHLAIITSDHHHLLNIIKDHIIIL